MNGGDQRPGSRKVRRSAAGTPESHSSRSEEAGSSLRGAAESQPGLGWSVSLQLNVKRDGDIAFVHTNGYLNREGGLEISKLIQRLAVEGTSRIELDLRGSPLVNVRALEILLQAKRVLSDRGVELCLVGAAPAVAKVLQLMKVAEEVKRARQ